MLPCVRVWKDEWKSALSQKSPHSVSATPRCEGRDFIIYKVLFSVFLSIQMPKKSKVIFNFKKIIHFKRTECIIGEMWKLASSQQRHFPPGSLSADSCLLQPKPDKVWELIRLVTTFVASFRLFLMYSLYESSALVHAAATPIAGERCFVFSVIFIEMFCVLQGDNSAGTSWVFKLVP